jgi:hypothetical protein
VSHPWRRWVGVDGSASVTAAAEERLRRCNCRLLDLLHLLALHLLSLDLRGISGGGRNGHRFRRRPDLEKLQRLVDMCLHLDECIPHLGAHIEERCLLCGQGCHGGRGGGEHRRKVA